MINILLTPDNAFALTTSVLMTSIGINTKSSVHYFFFLPETFTEENKKELRTTASEFGALIDFITIPDVELDRFPIRKGDRMPKEAYFRLLATKYLDEDVHKIIYLDGDIVVRKPLDELWETDIDDYALAACPDMREREIASIWAPYPAQEGYYNSGVLLINVDYWREHNSLALFSFFAKEHRNLVIWHDQDILNAVFHSKIKRLSVSYNFQSGFIERDNSEMTEDIASVMRNPAIVHYTVTKPWQGECCNPMRFAWFYYFKRCPAFKQNSGKLLNDGGENVRERLRKWLLRNNFLIPGIPRNYFRPVFIFK